MERRLLIAFLSVVAALTGNAGEFKVDAGVEATLVHAGPLPAFADGSMGKFRYGDDELDGGLLGGYFQVQSDYDAVWNAKLAVDINTQAGDGAGVIDAFVQYRPLPVGGMKIRAKVGAFRPPISFEHGADGWATLYTTNASAINSWVGEELGGLGAEVTIKRDIASSGSGDYWALSAAGFQGNDTSGTVLSWRGWSINNWQTPWGGHIDLPPLPIFDFLPNQEQRSEPFLELDDKWGYYLWGEVGRAGSVRVRALAYANRADPTVTGHGQTGWCTRFENVSVQIALPLDVGFVGQWMEGATYVGPVLSNGRHALDNEFRSYFALLTRSFGPHRVSGRYDWFRVDDRDLNQTMDPNEEDGRGWTLSYQYQLDERWLLGVEWVRIDSRRPARAIIDAPVELIEDAVFAVARWTL